jgi:hypothetical protein
MSAGTFAQLVQYGDSAVTLTMPTRTTFAQLHTILTQHWTHADSNRTIIVDSQSYTYAQ